MSQNPDEPTRRTPQPLRDPQPQPVRDPPEPPLHDPPAEEEEAREWWPQGKTWKPWSFGLWLEDATLLCKESKKWK